MEQILLQEGSCQLFHKFFTFRGIRRATIKFITGPCPEAVELKRQAICLSQHFYWIVSHKISPPTDSRKDTYNGIYYHAYQLSLSESGVGLFQSK
jgi:hypothetical protein